MPMTLSSESALRIFKRPRSPAIAYPKIIDLSDRFFEASFVASNGVRFKNSAIEIVSEFCIERKSIAVKAKYIQQLCELSLHVRAASQEMDGPIKAVEWQGSASVPGRDAKSQNKSFGY